MAYITTAYYLTTYYGIDPDPSDTSARTALNRLIARAGDAIDNAVAQAIVVADLDTEQADLLQKACAAQVEFYTMNGDTFNEPEVAGGESIGKFQRQTGLSQRVSPAGLCSKARAHLVRSGLMYRGARIR